MQANDTYMVREFARLAGVTVRTLHYYDETGLLKPSLHTAARHRLYRRADLLRLQQIVTLKQLGFSLDAIRALLDSPAFDMRQALRAQRQAIEQQIAQLQTVAQTLDQTLGTIERQGAEALDWEQLAALIHVLQATPKWQWAAQHFSPEQRAALEARGRDITPEQLVEWERAWAGVYAGFEAHRAKRPDHPAIQRLAGRMCGLLDTFTQGDAQAEQALAEVWADDQRLPPEWQRDPALRELMCQAIAIYRQGHPRALMALHAAAATGA